MKEERERVKRLGKKMKGHSLLCSWVLFGGSGQGETKQADEEDEENGEGATSHVPGTWGN